MPTIGYDLPLSKLERYRQCVDPSGALSEVEKRAATQLTLTADASALRDASFIVVAAPLDAAYNPDYAPLIRASESVAEHLQPGTSANYDSTVYSGSTEAVRIPVLERVSGLQWKRDFHVGYSPKHFNPGDQHHSLTDSIEAVAWDGPNTLNRFSTWYERVVAAGVHRASSLRLAGAAKVIENTQRNLNIALMNELAVIVNRIGLDMLEVLEAAGTKWNILPFRSGLVGSHCMGIGKYIAKQTVKMLIQAGSSIKGAALNVLGFPFKENVPDLRNLNVWDLIAELRAYKVEVFVHDPVADASEALQEHGITLNQWHNLSKADAVVVAVAHQPVLSRPAMDFAAELKPNGCFVDAKMRLDTAALNVAGFNIWRL